MSSMMALVLSAHDSFYIVTLIGAAIGGCYLLNYICHRVLI